MIPRLAAALLLASTLACTADGRRWRSAPVALSPAPVLLRPAVPLDPGRVGAELCVGLPAALLALAPGVPSRADDPDRGVRPASGELLRVHAVLRTQAGAPWVDSTTSLRDSGEGPFEYCTAGAIPRAPGDAEAWPRLTSVELRATVPVRVSYVAWRATTIALP